ncbi:MAG: metalloprotease PmbA [gamma proteobacterium symbiont of Bathyaustriella thionipta]|nr:metalloprotease PmbA [gamma proteobacterium symbiont of Bathyaustriella thionipta]
MNDLQQPAGQALFDSRQLIDDYKEAVSSVLKQAGSRGAGQVEAGVSSSSGLSLTVRMGDVETIERIRDNAFAVSVYIKGQKGSASSTDISPHALTQMVEKACSIARHSMPDSCAGLADAERLARHFPDLELYHPWSLDIDQASRIALQCEQAARQVKRVSNSEGASLNTSQGVSVYGNSQGFLAGSAATRHSLSCSVIAQQDGQMQSNYWYSNARSAKNLQNPHEIGQQAGQRAVARLGARSLSTRQSAIILQADVASGLWRHLIAAISGSSLYRGASFLLDSLHQKLFPSFVQVYEEPQLIGGVASSAYDNEGVATRHQDFIKDGILQSWVLGSYSARKLKLPTTGNAGGVRNLMVKPGDQNLSALLREMNSGLLVTEMMGQGVNLVTGDYSRGAAGFWVEGGEIQYPVEEITIAGNLRDMFAGIQTIANDVDRRGNIQSGSILINRMTIAGN